MAESLSDKIAGILNTAPTNFDPEDDVNEDTTARIDIPYEADNCENVVELSQNLSQFRKQNVELLEEVDKRYEGQRASRKKVSQYDQWDSESEIDDDAADLENSSSEGSEGTEDEESSIEGSENTDEYSSDKDDNSKNMFKDVEKTSKNKSTCVRQQLNIWERFLEMRIQLQKCLLTANKLPQSTHYVEMRNDSTSDFDAEARKATGTVKNVLDKFLLLQTLLLQNYPETKMLLSEKESKIQSDEEIPSDTDEEQSQQDLEVPSTKRMKLDDYGNELTTRFDLYHNYRNSILQKWHDKVQIGTNKSGNVVHSVTEQIKHILSSKEKLIRATQLKRTDYEILGENVLTDEQNVDVFNTEIFDDTDFYHHLLRELIEFKSSDLTDPVQLGRQWMQLQSLRSKMKKKVDTKATKGRKIRYVVHSKLVNFMAPVEDITWQESAKTELYNSLFGKNQIHSKTSSER